MDVGQLGQRFPHGVLDVTVLGHQRGIVGNLDRLAPGRSVPAPQRLFESHALDRAAVRHRQQKRPHPPAVRVEPLGLLPQANEHVLHDLFGERLVGQDPQREPVHRGHVLAVDLTKGCFVAGYQARGQVSIAGVLGH